MVDSEGSYIENKATGKIYFVGRRRELVVLRLFPEIFLTQERLAIIDLGCGRRLTVFDELVSPDLLVRVRRRECHSGDDGFSLSSEHDTSTSEGRASFRVPLSQLVLPSWFLSLFEILHSSVASSWSKCVSSSSSGVASTSAATLSLSSSTLLLTAFDTCFCLLHGYCHR